MGLEEEEEEQASSLSAAPKTSSLLLGLCFQKEQPGRSPELARKVSSTLPHR